MNTARKLPKRTLKMRVKKCKTNQSGEAIRRFLYMLIYVIL